MIDEIPKPPQGIKGMTREPAQIEKGALVKLNNKYPGQREAVEEEFRSPDGTYRVLHVTPVQQGGFAYLIANTLDPYDVEKFNPSDPSWMINPTYEAVFATDLSLLERVTHS